jgi:thymidine kinase
MKNCGYLEVIAGPMYCGKTEELIRQVKRATIGRKNIIVFKHAIDTRYGKDQKVHSHSGISFQSINITHSKEIVKHIRPSTDMIAIDEAQWFGEDLVKVVQKLLTLKKHVIVAGLAMTFDCQPFAPMPTLMAIADKVTKLSAICSICGSDAVFHKRLVKGKSPDALSTDPSFVAGLEAYEARCRICYNK